MPEPIYLEPAEELLQGDIFDAVPSVWVDARPLLVARYFQHGKHNRPTYVMHGEDGDDPSDGYRWENRQDPELILIKALRGRAIVLTHDCEIENEPDHRHVAPVRPMTDLAPEYRDRCRAGERWDAFPLEAQEQEPAMAESFIDFRKLTTLRPAAFLASVKIASLSEQVRKAMSRAYWNYLYHAFQPPRAPIG